MIRTQIQLARVNPKVKMIKKIDNMKVSQGNFGMDFIG